MAIKIKPSHKGLFTKEAKAAGCSVQAYAASARAGLKGFAGREEAGKLRPQCEELEQELRRRGIPMAEYDNNFKGVLYKNDKKTEDKHPEYKGSGQIDGIEYWISAWIKTAGQNAKVPGSKFMSLAFTPKNQSGGTSTQTTSTVPAEDIPF